ncbi:hypothetical protein ACQP1K_09815 [Sphaerimonospora sp. CA-214678]|uniref:hypothetical protein n=1 Tax=Sphaerimonospora sp. CA-214678 TaxID=3240029 RepID=UPI003D8C52CC
MSHPNPNQPYGPQPGRTGELSGIIANDNITGPARVTLKKGEYFETKRCQPWKRVG